MKMRHESVLRIFVGLIFVAGACGQQAQVAQSGPQKFRISGVVVSALTGEALAKTEVMIGKSQGEETLQSTMSGADGRFAFDGLAAEKYWLRAERKGFARQAFEEHEGFFTGIAVGKGFDTEHLVFRLRPDATITGQVTDDADEPVRDATVMLFRRVTENGLVVTRKRAEMMSNDEGRYRFSHLVPGTYFVVVAAQPWYAEESNVGIEGKMRRQDLSGLDVAYAVTYFSGATDSDEATPLTLKASDRVTADVRLNAVPTLHLNVRLPSGNADEPWTAHLSQRVFDEDIPSGTREKMNPGILEVEGMGPGEYELTVSRMGENPRNWTQNVAIQGDTEISAGADEATGVIVRGTVRMDGMPLKEGLVQLWNRESGERMSAQISEKGEFEIQEDAVEAGRYEVIVGNNQHGLVSSVSARGAKAAGQVVTLGSSGAVELTITLMRGVGQIDGMALQDGKPVSGMMVVLVPQDPRNQLEFFRRDQSDLDGTFTLREILPGKYTVVALRDAWDLDWSNGDFLTRFLAGGTSVEVRPEGKYDLKVNAQNAGGS